MSVDAKPVGAISDNNRDGIGKRYTEAPAALFLGAGASAAFGFPTTQEFLYNLQTKMAVEAKTPENEILQALAEPYGNQDIEQVLEILDQVVEHETPLLKFLDHHKVPMPSRATYAGLGTLPWKDFSQIAASLRRIVRDELFIEYRFKLEKWEQILRVYEDVLNALSSQGDIIHVFTTNYDSVVEEGLLHSNNYAAADGFRTGASGMGEWDPRVFDERQTDHKVKINLYKLHGSLSWRMEKTGRIARVPTEEKVAQEGGRFAENVLLYPASQKATDRGPIRHTVHSLH